MNTEEIFDNALKLNQGEELIVETFDQTNQNSLRAMLFKEKKKCLESDAFPELKEVAKEIYFRCAVNEAGELTLKVGRRPQYSTTLHKPDGTVEKVKEI